MKSTTSIDSFSQFKGEQLCQYLVGQNKTINQPQSKDSLQIKLINIPSNVSSGLQLLQSSWNKIIAHSMIQCMSSIKQRECLALKCEIFIRTLENIVKRKTKSVLKESCVSIKNSMKVVLPVEIKTNIYFSAGDELKGSLSTSIGLDSIKGSLQLQRPRVFCDNCKKLIQTKSTIKQQTIIEQSHGLEYNLEDPSILQPGIFYKNQTIPKKIINLIPDEIFSSVGDQNTEFIKLQHHALFSNTNYQINNESPLELLTLKQVDSSKEYHPLQQIRTADEQYMRTQAISPVSHLTNIEKSFIDRLLIEQLKHSTNPTSPPMLPNPREVSHIEESQIFPINYESKDLFIKSIQTTRTPSVMANIYGVNNSLGYSKIPSKYTDSQIKNHILNYRRISHLPEHVINVLRKQVEETVGIENTRNNELTFFETAYYFK